ncbi:penicillin-binding protein activator LpoB [Cytophagales bacterium LB-30]|uniref:Penicillin-binding protein activator LpoB n=1 Tax=Shiella aurantiaca TaxID=3058365 RepID=A0ABT8F4R4_9BACT|nr:penicillin-binding protein activator LpoB [Shiella aurantiaca]MDN4165436.1 penicillin-binding protein activator LpoB [Shiella aurantiaca]
MRQNVGTFALLLVMVIFGACNRSVTRVDPNQTIDLSGRWNDTDSKLVAKEMIEDVLKRPWRENFYRANQKNPVVIVGMITNKSHEHIDADIFIKDMEKEFINSGMVRVVDNGEFREKLRVERAQQQDFASPETQAKWGRELGANYMLFGTVNSQIDELGKKKVVNYKVNLWLTDLETSEKVWLGDKEIKKYIVN